MKRSPRSSNSAKKRRTPSAAIDAAVVGDELHLGVEQRNRLLRSYSR